MDSEPLKIEGTPAHQKAKLEEMLAEETKTMHRQRILRALWKLAKEQEAAENTKAAA